MLKVGIDIGGTFTDILVADLNTGDMVAGKTLTTPSDPSIGAAKGLSEVLDDLNRRFEDVHPIVHGTTLVTNAIIERKGALTALVTTKGFRDVLQIAREKRYDVYDIFIDMPEPLIPRRLRKEITERVLANGRVWVPLDKEDVIKALEAIKEAGAKSVAICFLHSYKNDCHEKEAREIIETAWPEACISLSCEVVPEIREYERTSTTVANAYTQPLIKEYLGKLESELKRSGFGGSLYVMLSSGGIGSAQTGQRFPVRLMESGPAAGAAAASWYGQLMKEDRVLSFDMGGTTAKICLIEGGTPMVTSQFEVARVYRFKRGSGLPLKLPVVDMIEIGAGGGSIARLDRVGLLKVGPDSSGADPGPACYGLGGVAPTVTDADLILGYLNPSYFLGGKMPLYEEGARQSIARAIAEPLGISVEKAALGIHEIVNENMANAAKVHSVERGRDPKSYALIAFGGAGPVHAYGVARKLGIKKIISPLAAGVTSALGLLVVPFSFDLVRTYLSPLKDLDWAEVNRIVEEMEAEGLALMAEAGIDRAKISITRTCDMRYAGQGHEVSVPLPTGRLEPGHTKVIMDSFEARYRELFYRTNQQLKVETLNWRVCIRGPRPPLHLKEGPVVKASPDIALKASRPAYFAELGQFINCPVYDHYRLSPGMSIKGPAIVEERESTTIIGPSASAYVDQYLSIVMEVK